MRFRPVRNGAHDDAQDNVTHRWGSVINAVSNPDDAVHDGARIRHGVIRVRQATAAHCQNGRWPITSRHVASIP